MMKCGGAVEWRAVVALLETLTGGRFCQVKISTLDNLA
jgi:hypothetical protein